jgi:hypothetical protein
MYSTPFLALLGPLSKTRKDSFPREKTHELYYSKQLPLYLPLYVEDSVPL